MVKKYNIYVYVCYVFLLLFVFMSIIMLYCICIVVFVIWYFFVLRNYFRFVFWSGFFRGRLRLFWGGFDRVYYKEKIVVKLVVYWENYIG